MQKTSINSTLSNSKKVKEEMIDLVTTEVLLSGNKKPRMEIEQFMERR